MFYNNAQNNNKQNNLIQPELHNIQEPDGYDSSTSNSSNSDITNTHQILDDDYKKYGNEKMQRDIIN